MLPCCSQSHQISKSFSLSFTLYKQKIINYFFYILSDILSISTYLLLTYVYIYSFHILFLLSFFLQITLCISSAQILAIFLDDLNNIFELFLYHHHYDNDFLLFFFIYLIAITHFYI